MRGLVLREIGVPLELSDGLELTPPGPGEVRVRLRAVGVCHSDLSLCNGTLPQPTPLVPGHEGAGEVVAVGEGVIRPQVGDHVVLSWIPPCGSCFFCLGGQPNLCPYNWQTNPRPVLSLEGEPVNSALGTGAFAEETVVPAAAAVPIPVDVPFEIAALVGCGVLTGVGAVLNTARVRPGESVVVIGCGGVGVNVLQGARLAGATPILAVDQLPGKLAGATGFGATHTATPDQIPEAIAELTGGLGFDNAFEVVGRSATIRQAWDATRRGGTTVVVGAGSLTDEVRFSAGELFLSEKRLLGSLYGSADVRTDFARMLRLWQGGRLDLEKLISRTIALDEVGEAFAAMERGEVIRSVINL
ncbi:Zn-dependent alcohol dehydrogenase [Planosporangium mesophilum]|uniref:Alcohol dehydrogenase n=1 Tax=Planosporangium mesophilum TaxID=689768 RepID=A0A8J3X1R0_9ACTN|nr:Zn-dependent alcohol dehydrogenase [Planosporangium mesophilum]NJC82932.1 Zn-dependent alcohol dehydrogenase [Planosporangium mesophilum]GII24710.1 alcohol dehydrogenase [Planosporangium mesophilum]